MPALTSQRNLREVRSLPFCHFCGKHLVPTDRVDRDHIPPSSCFDKVDRSPPLKLQSHVTCNNSHKLNDEKVGQLLAAHRHRSADRAPRIRVELLTEQTTGFTVATFRNLDLIGSIRRWIGGFHAALYRESLSQRTLFQITPPMPHAAIGEQIVLKSIPSHLPAFVRTLKLNRAARNLDRIVANNGKLRYECVWAQEDNGPNWLCIFALDLYGWVDLGDARFGARGCTGTYLLDSGQPPRAATRATRLEAPVPNSSPFDPFGI